MLADMDHAVSAVGIAQPEVERQVSVGRHQIRVVIHRARIDLIAPRRLNADEGQAETQTRDHHPAVAAHRVGIGRSPTFQHRLTIGLRQRVEHPPIIVHGQALLAWTLVEGVQVVADTAEQLLDQRSAAVRQFGR
ncbi:hypothetical protein D3C81_1418260 [compost metagenome]